MASAKTERLFLLEQGPRSALLVWGGAFLIVGIGLVGVGEPAVGSPLLLAGLLNVIYGIHTYGRLGPEDETPDADTIAATARSTTAWTGGLTALAGLVVAVDHSTIGGVGGAQSTAGTLVTYALVVLGLGRVMSARSKPKVKAKVERRRRMDKSAAP